jgi:hypothetical protein
MPAERPRPHTYGIVRWPTAPVLEEWEQPDDFRPAAAVSAVNVLAFLLGNLFDQEDLTGICLAISLFLLMGCYLFYERKQPRTAIALAAGSLPFWIMFLSVL